MDVVFFATGAATADVVFFATGAATAEVAFFATGLADFSQAEITLSKLGS